MNELLEKIYENVIRQEDDTLDMEKRINDCMEEYISHYDDISEKDKERIRDFVYYAVLISEKEAFQLGIKYAKILASFTFTIFIFMWFVLVNLVLCWMIYGLKGFENISWMVLSQHMLQPVLFLKYLGILLGLAFQALLSLCAITLCVSAYQNSSFGAVIIAAVCWGLPVLIRMFFGGIIWLIVDSMPIFLVMTGIVNDIYEIWYIVLGINICFAIGCLVKGLVSYKTKQFA
jgi:hypothetical protein